ncbi:hypothetical protein H0A71_05675 [Alcaligenaceae bacterium]|nr:hypothetical protein [Alcaligenaceae bacterium]
MQTLQNLNDLLDIKEAGPYISLYQPTHRQHPENKQDPILFRNLVKQIEESLSARYSKDSIIKALAPFEDLAADTDFWNHTSDGIGVFGAEGFFRVMPIHRPTTQLAIVADSFHIKPLLRIFQSADRFQVLCLSRQTARLFEGNRDGLNEVPLAAGVPSTASEIIGDDLPEPVSRMRTTGSTASLSGRTDDMRYSHGSKADVIDKQTERFFREVDRAFIANHSKQSGLPLILAALPEHHALFREVSHNSQLLDEGVDINPDALKQDELRTLSWKIMEPLYIRRLAGLVDEFNAARNAQQASADLSDVAVAAVAGRVRVLLLEAGRQIPGRIDLNTGAVQFDKQEDPKVDDMLDDLGEQVLRTGGEVIMVPTERMPDASGLAAIFRY